MKNVKRNTSSSAQVCFLRSFENYGIQLISTNIGSIFGFWNFTSIYNIVTLNPPEYEVITDDSLTL